MICQRFNRTFMELKQLYHGVRCACGACFNRTFMELKHWSRS